MVQKKCFLWKNENEMSSYLIHRWYHIHIHSSSRHFPTFSLLKRMRRWYTSVCVCVSMLFWLTRATERKSKLNVQCQSNNKKWFSLCVCINAIMPKIIFSMFIINETVSARELRKMNSARNEIKIKLNG